MEKPAINFERLFSATVANSLRITPDSKCICFACGKEFSGAEISDYILENPYSTVRTALCPHCGMETVVTMNDLPDGTSFSDELRLKMAEYFWGKQ